MIFPVETDREKEWQKERDFETLMRASVIVADKERLQGAKDFASEQKKKLDDVLSDDFLKKIGFKK
jgi:hypothetical protein